MTDILQGDIVFTPFPFTDLTTTKRRPVLVVSNNTINKNKKMGDFVGLAVTSKLYEGPYTVQVDANDLENGNLPKRSEIHCDKICTIEKRLISKRLCQLNNTAFSTVKSKLIEVFK